jgi:hypothetical protein
MLPGRMRWNFDLEAMGVEYVSRLLVPIFHSILGGELFWIGGHSSISFSIAVVFKHILCRVKEARGSKKYTLAA